MLAPMASVTNALLGQLIGPDVDASQDPSPLLADNVDPATRDFADLFVGMDPVDAQVLVALTTIRGSGAAVENDGVPAAPRKMTDALARELEGDARLALRRLVEFGDVQIISAAPDVVDDSVQFAQMRVSYHNLRTGRRVDALAPLPVPGVA